MGVATEPSRSQHHALPSGLMQSVQNGCAICTLFFDEMEPRLKHLLRNDTRVKEFQANSSFTHWYSISISHDDDHKGCPPGSHWVRVRSKLHETGFRKAFGEYSEVYLDLILVPTIG